MSAPSGNYRWGTPYSTNACDHLWSPWDKGQTLLVRWCLFCSSREYSGPPAEGE